MGEATARFLEDDLRILRGLRLEEQLGFEMNDDERMEMKELT